ncbi:MAG: hypothetical protein EA394_08595 [Bacteroidia bacterium]|nr:MAG: hypothetical protein EA394_08595 [Bacteroidia bacterium]
MEKTMILGILVYDRIKEAGKTQEILSRHAEIIRTRLGFHELSDTVCSRVGTIILVLHGQPGKWEQLEEDLQQIGGVEIKKMTFEFLFK